MRPPQLTVLGRLRSLGLSVDEWLAGMSKTSALAYTVSGDLGLEIERVRAELCRSVEHLQYEVELESNCSADEALSVLGPDWTRRLNVLLTRADQALGRKRLLEAFRSARRS